MAVNVTVADVRGYLSELPDQRVGDPTVQTNIRLATNLVNAKAHASATDQQKEDAILTLAGCYTCRSYVFEYERTAGQVPGPILANLQAYCEQAEVFLEIVMGVADSEEVKEDLGLPVLVLSTSKRIRLAEGKTYSDASDEMQ